MRTTLYSLDQKCRW